MTDRVQRLKKLLVLQEQLKAMHEMRHAGFVAEAVAAKQEAAEIVDRFNAEDSMSAMFPELYHRRGDFARRGEQETRRRRGSEGRDRDGPHQHGRA